MNILLCGHRSFAAKGLIAALRRAGHHVVAFGRGPVGRSELDPAGAAAEASVPIVTGPVEAMDENPHLRAEAEGGAPFDSVINYILLKDDGVEKNVAFVAALLRFCRNQPGRPVSHLVHISSISSYKASARLVDELAEIETVPERKGSYGSLKVATDLYLLRETPPQIKLSLVRPGFVLGAGLINPIVGTAARLPWNKLLVIGNGKSVIPMTTRDVVNEAVVRAVSSPPAQGREVLVLADPASPTRVEFLQTCCRELGIGTGVTSLPVPLWWSIAVGGEAFARAIGQGKLQPYSKLTARLARQRFESARTAKRLGMDLSVDWRTWLRQSLDGQEPNYQPPVPPEIGLPRYLPQPRARANGVNGEHELDGRAVAGRVTFLGFGRIVKQKHLPALKKIGFAGEVRAFDLRPADPGPDTKGVRVEPIQGAQLPDSDLLVVASPGPAHVDALRPLESVRGPVLVEKPLGYSEGELRRWVDFAASRPGCVYVCHNYRLKQNVRRMMSHLARFNPGRLHHATLQFFSPPASNDSAPWLRDERRARTLLMDYALHFLDLACLFGPAPADSAEPTARGTVSPGAVQDRWEVGPVRYELNGLGQTSLIEGQLSGNYSVHFLLRQGFGPRRARVWFVFQNYSVSLGFFPDTFAAWMADDNPWLFKAEAADSRRQTLRKIVDRLSNRDSDDSHARVLAGALAGSPAVQPLTVPRLAPFYRALFDIGRAVYDPPEAPNSGPSVVRAAVSSGQAASAAATG